MINLLAPRSLGKSIDFCHELPADPAAEDGEEFDMVTVKQG